MSIIYALVVTSFLLWISAVRATPIGNHTCTGVVKHSVTVRVNVTEPVTYRTYTWCLRVPPRCSKYTVKLKDRVKIHTEMHNRTITVCCKGYVEMDYKCVPACPPMNECPNMHCNRTNHCYCTPGYQGLYCNYPCDRGFWGTDCKKPCDCPPGYICHHLTGDCMLDDRPASSTKSRRTTTTSTTTIAATTRPETSKPIVIATHAEEPVTEIALNTTTTVRTTEIPTTVRTTEMPTTVRTTEMPTTVRTTEMPTTVRTTEMPTTVRTTEMPTTVRTTEMPTTVRTTEIPSTVKTTKIPTTITTQIPTTETTTEIPTTETTTEIPTTLTSTEIPTRKSPITVRTTENPTTISTIEISSTESFISTKATTFSKTQTNPEETTPANIIATSLTLKPTVGYTSLRTFPVEHPITLSKPKPVIPSTSQPRTDASPAIQSFTGFPTMESSTLKTASIQETKFAQSSEGTTSSLSESAEMTNQAVSVTTVNVDLLENKDRKVTKTPADLYFTSKTLEVVPVSDVVPTSERSIVSFEEFVKTTSMSSSSETASATVSSLLTTPATVTEPASIALATTTEPTTLQTIDPRTTASHTASVRIITEPITTESATITSEQTKSSSTQFTSLLPTIKQTFSLRTTSTEPTIIPSLKSTTELITAPATFEKPANSLQDEVTIVTSHHEERFIESTSPKVNTDSKDIKEMPENYEITKSAERDSTVSNTHTSSHESTTEFLKTVPQNAFEKTKTISVTEEPREISIFKPTVMPQRLFTNSETQLIVSPKSTLTTDSFPKKHDYTIYTTTKEKYETSTVRKLFPNKNDTNLLNEVSTKVEKPYLNVENFAPGADANDDLILPPRKEVTTAVTIEPQLETSKNNVWLATVSKPPAHTWYSHVKEYQKKLKLSNNDDQLKSMKTSNFDQHQVVTEEYDVSEESNDIDSMLTTFSEQRSFRINGGNAVSPYANEEQNLPSSYQRNTGYNLSSAMAEEVHQAVRNEESFFRLYSASTLIAGITVLLLISTTTLWFCLRRKNREPTTLTGPCILAYGTASELTINPLMYETVYPLDSSPELSELNYDHPRSSVCEPLYAEIRY